MGDFAVSDDDMEYATSRSALDDHWNKIIADGFAKAVEIYTEDAVLELPQSGQTISGREKIGKYRATKAEKIVRIERVRGRADVWITEYLRYQNCRSHNIISIMEFRDGKVVRETEYCAEQTAKTDLSSRASKTTGRPTRGTRAIRDLM
jgi:hypothetical protein